jgi:ribosomal protein S27AE
LSYGLKNWEGSTLDLFILMRNYTKKSTTLENFEIDLQKRICPNCHTGVMMGHHEHPDKWIKCGICGYTTEIPEMRTALIKYSLIDIPNSDMPSEGEEK